MGISFTILWWDRDRVNKSWTVLEDPEQLTTISMYNKYLILGFISDAFHQLSAKFIHDLLIGIGLSTTHFNTCSL